MRQVFPLALSTALLLAIPVAMAQHAAAGHSGGYAGASAGHGFSGGHATSGFAGRYSGSRVPTSVRTSRTRSVASRNLARRRMTSSARRRPVRRPSYRYRSPYRANGLYPYPIYANSWDLVPWDLGYPDFTGYDDQPAQDAPDAASQQEDSAPAQQDDSRAEYGGGRNPSLASASSQLIAPEPQLMLIFRDGHREAIRNYLLTRKALFVMDHAASGHQQRIPLTDLNLSATEQEAEQAGLQFTPPA